MSWKKRMIGAVLTVAILTGTGAFAAAATEVSENVIFDLKSLNVLQGDENGELHLDEQVTRAEYVTLMTRLIQMQDWNAQKGRTDFTDVQENDWFYDAVYWMTDSGAVNGYGDGTFRPDAPVTADEAIKILITLLGYADAAEELGGYPQGYLSIANSSRLTRGVNIGEGFCRADAVLLIDNSLDVYLNVPDYMRGKGTVSAKNRETLRDRLMGVNFSDTLYEIRGVVQANATTWIIPGEYENLRDDEIIIDGTLYRTDVPDAANFIGKQVECYVAVNDDTRVIQSIRETTRNHVIEITDEDFISAEQGSVTYLAKDKEKRLRISDTAVLLKNMRLAEQWSERDITLSQGSLTLIDNNDDNAYDVIHIQEFESYLVSDVNTDVIYFKIHGDKQDKKLINFALDNDVDYIITDADGALLEVEDLQKDTVVSIMESEDGSLCKIAAGQPSFSSVLTTAGADTLTFDEKEYSLECGFIDEYQLGNEYQVYLNFRGEIYMLDKVKESERAMQYGYVAEVQTTGAFESEVRVLMAEPGEFVEVEEKSAVEDDDSVLLKLKGQNKSLKELACMDSVRVNGVKMKAPELMAFFHQGGTRSNRVVSYRVNAEGKISEIEFPEVCGRELTTRDEQRVYNAQEKVFGGMRVGAFGATEATKVLMIPDFASQGAVSKNDYQAVVEINDGQAYTVNGYDVGERECVDLITIMTTMQYDASSAILDTDKMALLEEAVTVLDEEGNPTLQLGFWSDGKAMSYIVEDRVRTLAGALSEGDIFYYAVSPSSDKINKIIRIDNVVTPDRGMGQFGQPADSNPEGLGQITAGTVSDIAYEQIIDISNRRKDCLTIDLGGGESVEVRVNSRNAPALYRYNKRTNVIEAITARDIIPGNGTVMVHIKNNTVRGLVVVQ